MRALRSYFDLIERNSDKVFYSEINRRLILNKKGIIDTIILNAQNKQIIHRIAGPLRNIGILC